jgi:hypothetical protein
VLIHVEAGGHAAMLGGEVYTPVLHAYGQLLLTPGPGSWRNLAPLVD